MNDKEKQIEEMVQIQQNGCINNSKEDCSLTYCLRCYSKILYNAGYRKLDDHAIMVLRKAKGMEDKIRKETAEKFLQLAYDRCLEKSFIKKVEELAKQYGVEIEE
jgi:hypothetical protein